MTNRPTTKPEDLFRAEKERALTVRNSQHARLLAEAKAAFDKLMAEGQAARKSGRPRKHPLPPLKTSSARPVTAPMKPVAPPEVVKAAAPAAPAVPTAPAAAAKPPAAVRPAASAKPTKAAKPVRAKKAVKAASKSKSKSKPKAKRSTRR